VVTLLLLTLLLPALTGTALVLGGRRNASWQRMAGTAALAASIATALTAVGTVVSRPVLDRAWVPALGWRWHFAVDGISAPLVLLTALLSVAVVVHTRHGVAAEPHPPPFYGCLLIVEAGALATFLARDAVVFFLAFETVLVPMWVLIGRYGDPHDAAARADASARFVLYTVLGSTLMLLGILALVHNTGTSDLGALAAASASAATSSGAGTSTAAAGTAPAAAMTGAGQTVVAALLLLGLGIKVPLWPFHTWLPPAHTVAPTAGSVLLAAVLLKMGSYGIVRLVVAPLPLGFARLAPVLGALGVVGILWGGLACLVENDLKRLVAYSSVAHMGFVALGLSTGTATGLQAALFANVAHAVVSALLFFVVGGLKARWGSADLRTARAALREVAPRMGVALVFGAAAALGLPGLVGFWGEFFTMYAAWSPAPGRPVGLFRVFAVLAVMGTGLAAAYALRVLRTVWSGDLDQPPLADARGAEWGVIATMATAVVVLGVLPGPLLATTAADVARITSGAGR